MEKIKKNKNSKKYKELKKYIERDIEKNYVFKSQGMSYIFFGKLKDSEKEEYSLLGINSILTLERKEMSFIKDNKTEFIEAFSVVKEEGINNNSEKYNYTLIKIKENIKFTEDILEYVHYFTGTFAVIGIVSAIIFGIAGIYIGKLILKRHFKDMK